MQIKKTVTLYIVTANKQEQAYTTNSQAASAAEVLTAFGIASEVAKTKREVVYTVGAAVESAE